MGSGRSGLGRRAGWIAVGWLTGATTEYSVARYREVDITYHLCRCNGFPKRAEHALHAGVIEYRADGTEAFAVSRFSGLAARAFITMPMLPPGYGTHAAVERALTTFGVDEGFNLLYEFRKEIIRTLLLRGTH